MKFIELPRTFEALELTTKRLEITDILAEFFKKADAKDIDKTIYLLQGRVLPSFAGVEIGMGDKFAEQAIAKATGHTQKETTKLYQKLGDLGLAAEELSKDKKQLFLQSESLTIKHVYDAYMKMALVSGTGSQDQKINIMIELLNSAEPVEAKYLVRIPLGKLALGIGEPTILDALSVKESGDKSLREVLERAFNYTSDLGYVTKTLYEKGMKGVESIQMIVTNPVIPALAERLSSAEEIIERLGKCAVEKKYDGMRLQLHKRGKEVKIFSRKQEELTHMFPEVVKAAKEEIKADNVILDGEAIAYNEETGEYLPFQQTIQRKRKHDIAAMQKEFPIHVFVFDILFNGKNLVDETYLERRKVLEKTISGEGILKLSNMIITDSAEELTKYFDDAVAKGLEGIVAKDLNAPYTVGARKFSWIKLKRSYRSELNDTIDAVIIGYYKGKGKRTDFGLGGLLTAVYDADSDTFTSIARVGTGFSDEQLQELSDMLGKVKVPKKPREVDSDVVPDFWVEPKYVVELIADEITKSPMHTTGRVKGVGYALRFPRIVNYRFDKAPQEATSVSEIISMYGQQKHTEMEEN